MTTTDDTRQRSIDEVMGWEPVGDPACPDGWIKHDGTRIDEVCGAHPDVDDMLDWLIADGRRGVELSANMGLDSDGVVLVMEGYNEHGLWDVMGSHRAPTLHAALEAAVRAVAEASDE